MRARRSGDRRRAGAPGLLLGLALLAGLGAAAAARADEASAPEEAAKAEGAADAQAAAEAEGAADTEKVAEESSEGACGGAGAEEAEEPSAFAALMKDRGNQFLAGVTGLATFPADPVMDALEPSKQIQGLPGKYTENVVGFAGGFFHGLYRAWMGTLDIVLTPFFVFPTLSPQPNWNPFGVQYE